MVRTALISLCAILLIAACQSNKNDSGYSNKLAWQYGMDSTEVLPKGLAVNSLAPNIVTNTIDGEPFDLYKQLEEKPTVIIFYRGEWCPVCSRYFSRFQDSLQYIYKEGAAYIAIGPETPENGMETIRKSRLSIPIISDGDKKIMQDYDVDFKVTEPYVKAIDKSFNKNIAEVNGSDESYLPVPAVYIIDQNKKIRYRHFNVIYPKRAGVAWIVEKLQSLKETK